MSFMSILQTVLVLAIIQCSMAFAMHHHHHHHHHLGHHQQHRHHAHHHHHHHRQQEAVQLKNPLLQMLRRAHHRGAYNVRAGQ